MQAAQENSAPFVAPPFGCCEQDLKKALIEAMHRKDPRFVIDSTERSARGIDPDRKITQSPQFL
ncbi:MAG: hypothetical protein AB7I42_02730 [Bradyrhizobium sp.]|uniref:hypothetical protein n=1 Tax=Bradyrhizobium sp. TaxID=376 RepID=UPI002A2931E0|nr:hypothetical protein [Bradyrhizobium sp.]